MPAVVPMKSDFKLEYDSNIVELFPKQAKLRKDGTPKIIVQNKKRGRKSEVYPFSVQVGSCAETVLGLWIAKSSLI